jgi:hypothetical protein
MRTAFGGRITSDFYCRLPRVQISTRLVSSLTYFVNGGLYAPNRRPTVID